MTVNPPDPRFDSDFLEGFVAEVSDTLKDEFSPVFRQHEHIINVCFFRLKRQLEWNGLQSRVQLEGTPKLMPILPIETQEYPLFENKISIAFL